MDIHMICNVHTEQHDKPTSAENQVSSWRFGHGHNQDPTQLGFSSAVYLKTVYQIAEFLRAINVC